MYRYIFVREDSNVDIEYADCVTEAIEMFHNQFDEEPQAIIRSITEVPNA